MLIQQPLELMLAVHGENNYRGNYTGRKNGQRYHLFLENITGYDICISAWSEILDTEQHDKGFGGNYLAFDPESRGDDISFLQLPEQLEDKTIYLSRIEVTERNRGEGLSDALYNVMIEELKLKGVLHLVSFTEDGMERMKPKFEQIGYVPISTLSDANVPEWATPKKDWMYFDYGEGLSSNEQESVCN